MEQPCSRFDLPKYERASAVAGKEATVEVGHDFLGAKVLKFESALETLCPRHSCWAVVVIGLVANSLHNPANYGASQW